MALSMLTMNLSKVLFGGPDHYSDEETIVKRDVLMFRYHSGNSELYQLLDLLIKALGSIVSKHSDLVKYLVIMDKEESYLPISFMSHKNVLETITSLDSCLANQSSALSAFNTRERLIQLVLNSKRKIEELTSFSQNLTSLTFQLNEANNFVKSNMDEPLE
ncbi:hypothetical protein KSF78_0003471 [Schistosoma japonicum]|nr:hypothetical protein KSF78_0003471 [Schistosoma japonicum]